MGAVGQGQRRLEGGEKVTGQTQYTADLDLPGLLHVQLLLSHLPNARIRGIDVKAARAMPGVVDVVVGADLPPQDLPIQDQPLAMGRVLYVGQAVAAVIAATEAEALDAVAMIGVDYEPLPSVVDPIAAMRDDAPIVLESTGDDAAQEDASIHGAASSAEVTPAKRIRNVSGVAHYERGDVTKALADAPVVIKGTYASAGVHQGFLEPHVAMVRPEPNGELTIWAPTQGPFAVRDHIAKMLKVTPGKVTVVPMAVGGGFGGKVLLLEPLLALLAVRARKPLKLVLTRQQEFLVGKPAPAASYDLEIGADREGILLGLRVRFHYDNGATGGWHAGLAGSFFANTYRISNYDITGYEVSTHKTPVEAYRAPGAPQSYFALETAIDELAQKLDLDPIEIRLRNAVREGDPTVYGFPYPRIALIECLEAARKSPVYSAPLAEGEAVGIAVGAWGGARTPAAAGCRVESDGTLSVLVGSVDISGSSTSLAMIAAEAFGTSVDKVRMETADTGSAPFAPVAGGSQIIYSVGGAVHEAATEARRQLFEIATEELEAAPEDLEITDGRVTVRGVPDRFVEITKLVAMSTEFMGKHKPIHASGRSVVRGASPMFTVHIARAKTDTETGHFKITGFAAIQDVGRAINPPEVEAQIHGGAVQSLGRALGEQLAYDEEGQLRTASFLDYEMPTADQIANIDVQIIEVPSPIGPLGAKGVGEPPAVPAAPALANAISRASGVRIRTLPIDRSLLVHHP